MKIQSINIKNYKGIKSLEKEINGGNVYLVGANETCKSSFIDAVWSGLTGNLPPEPTTDGVKKGLIEIDLGDFIARTKITKGKPTVFELENKVFNNETDKFIKAPRTYLNNRIGIIDFDVNEFFAKTDLKKLEYLSKTLDVDFSNFDADIEEAMESRKFNKNRLKDLSAKVEYYDATDADKPIIDIVKLSEEIAEQKEKVETYDRVERGILTTEGRVKELLEEVEILKDKIRQGKAWVGDPQNMHYPKEDRDKLTEKLKTANTDNEKIKSAKAGKLIDLEIEELEKEIETDSEAIEKLRASKAAAISEAIPVKELVYDVEKESFMYKGLPFSKDQQNTATNLITGMEIGNAMLKDLKILRIEASMIDKKNWAKVLEWANEKDIELFVELVDRDAENTTLQIIVE